MQADQFLKELLTVHKDPLGEQTLAQLSATGGGLAMAYDQLDPSSKETLLAVLKKAQENPDTFKKMIAASLHFYVSGDEGSAGVVDALFDDLSLPPAMVSDMMLAIVREQWVSGKQSDWLAKTFPQDRLFQRYRAIVAQAQKQVEERYGAFPLEIVEPKDDRAVIITQQMLGLGHAPSRDTLEFAYHLGETYGKEVLILNTLQFSPNPLCPFMPPMKASHLPGKAGVTTLEYRGKTFILYEPSRPVFNEDMMLEALFTVQRFEPSMAICVGGSNLVGDLIAQSIPTFLYPTTAGVPIVTHMPFMTWKDLGPAEQQTVLERGLGDQYLLASHPGFEPPPSAGELSRASLGLADDRFVFAVVGTRLGVDVNEAFTGVLRAILQSSDIAHILFLGNFEGFDAWLAANKDFEDRVTFGGFHSDIMGALSLADAYLNPDRIGGGSAVVYAMASGLPTLVLNRGDAAEAAKSLPPLETYDQMVDQAKRLLTEPAFKEERGKAAKTAAEQLTDRAPLVEKIMSCLKAVEDGTTEPLTLA